MNAIVKAILKAAEEAALQSTSALVPGAPLVIKGVKNLLDKDHANNGEAIQDIGNGVVAAVEGLKQEDVLDQVLVAQGANEVRSGVEKIRRGLKK